MTSIELERKVKNILRKNFWGVTSSAYYTDPITQKAREKDIVATNVRLTYDESTQYYARLFIECKVFPKITEVFENPNPDKMENALIHHNVPFARFDEIEKYQKPHFYEYKKIYEPKDREDFIFPAVNQNLQSLHAFRKSNNEKGLYFLIIVYSGELFAVDIEENKQKCEKVLVRIDTLDNTFSLSEGCFIELVSVDKFQDLLWEITGDIKKVDWSVEFYHRVAGGRDDDRRIIRVNRAR